MKFKAEPNLYVRINNKYVQRVTGKKGFYFDDKGEYETNNEHLIRALSPNFAVVSEDEELFWAVSDKREYIEPATESNEEKVNLTKQKYCKKCEFTCDTQGKLLKHYKVEHKREDSQ